MTIHMSNWFNHPIVDKLHGLQWGAWGGAARDYYFGREPRDVDIAVDCTEEELFSKFPGANKNRFGGLKIKDTIDFDLWPLASTWNIKVAKLQPTFENLASLGPYNADCLVLTHDGKLIDKGFLDCLRTKMLEVNFELNPHPQHNILRGLRIMDRLGIMPGASFANYVIRHRDGLDKEIVRYESFYGLKVNMECLEAILK